MNTHVFLITAKTNLHVGNESGGDFSIIDKAIQRDALTGLPCINSSSLKGAINEYCSQSPESGLKDKPEVRKKLFGVDKLKKGNGSQKGEAVFFDAKLLFLPQQDKDTLYHYVTSEDVIALMNERVRLFDPTFEFEKPEKFPQNDKNSKAVKYDKEELDIKSFTDICSDDNLPIIARNVLDNGESKNLWYEQVLPAETVFYTIIREEGEDLKNALCGGQKLVQIGADATIGYGFCVFECIHTIQE